MLQNKFPFRGGDIISLLSFGGYDCTNKHELVAISKKHNRKHYHLNSVVLLPKITGKTMH